MIEIIGSLWRWPTSKSFGSCAGVTFTAPVPNSGSTSIASATIGNLAVRRAAARTVLPIRPCSASSRVHGDGGVAEHRLRARRRHDDLARAVRAADSANSPELALLFLVVLDLEVGERGLAARAPVDHPLPR